MPKLSDVSLRGGEMIKSKSDLKEKKILIFATIFIFLSTFCSSCKKSEKTKAEEIAEVRDEYQAMEKTQPDKSQVQATRQAAPTQEELNEIVEKLQTYFQLLEDVVAQLPDDTFDPQAVVEMVGSEPIKLFEWVRDHTYLVAYEGALRGPKGVIMDRLGNSLDRAMLLHELIRLAGYEVRLARGTLSEEKAKKIFEKTQVATSRKASLSEEILSQDMNALIEKYAKEYQLDKAEFQEVFDRKGRVKEALAKKIAERVKEQTAAIFEAIKKYRKKEDRMALDSRYSTLKDHWWVQWEKDDNWVDLDPTFADNKPGEALTEVKQTFNPDDLDEDLIHSIKVRVIIERWEKGKLEKNTVFEYSLKPSELLGKKIILGHIPMNWPKDFNVFEEEDPSGSLMANVITEKEWMPILTINSDNITQSRFSIYGEIKKGEPEGGRGFAGGLLKAFTSEKEREEKAKKDSYLTAEWIEYEIISPGQRAKTIWREIFDFLGPSVRQRSNIPEPRIGEKQRLSAQLKLLGEIEILPIVCSLSPKFLEFLTAKSMITNKDIFISLFREYNSLEPEDILTNLGEINPLPGPIYELALARSKLSQHAPETYLDCINIINCRKFLQESSEGELVKFQCLDIIANDIAVRPGSSLDPFLVRLEQGVLDSNAEARVLGQEGWVESTGEIFAESKDQGIHWVAIQNVEDPEWQRIQLSQDVRARIENDLGNGFIVLVPPQQISIKGKYMYGWWRIEPQSGNTIGMGEHGLGQALSEYAEHVNVILQLKSIVEIWTDFWKCVGTILSSPLRGVRGVDDPLVTKCIRETVCKVIKALALEIFDVDVNWTNVIIIRTLDWVLDNHCKEL